MEDYVGGTKTHEKYFFSTCKTNGEKWISKIMGMKLWA